MTAAHDDETICVPHVLSLSIRLFDLIAISLSHAGLLLPTWLLLLMTHLTRLAGDSDIFCSIWPPNASTLICV